MNKFGEYVTSGAFSLNLSKRMVVMLLAQYDREVNLNDDAVIRELGSAFMPPLQALARRGLVYWKWNPRKQSNDDCYLTEAGKLLVPVLLHAGFELPSNRDAQSMKPLKGN